MYTHAHACTHTCTHTCMHMYRVCTESSIIKFKLLSVLSDWLGLHQDGTPLSNYFIESKLQAWSSFTEFLEDTLKSVRKKLSPLFENLRESISGRMIGKVSDTSLPDQTRAYFSPEQIQHGEWHKQNPVVTDTWSSFQILKSNPRHVQNTGAHSVFHTSPSYWFLWSPSALGSIFFFHSTRKLYLFWLHLVPAIKHLLQCSLHNLFYSSVLICLKRIIHPDVSGREPIQVSLQILHIE